MNEQAHRERKNAYQREWYLKNREKCKTYKKAYMREYSQKNREKMNGWCFTIELIFAQVPLPHMTNEK